MNWGRILFETDLFTGVSRRRVTFRRRDGWPGPVYFRNSAWRRHLILLTSQLGAIVRCNAPLAQGLEKAIGDAPPLKLMQAMIALRDDLAAGVSLSEAMARRPHFYPRWYVDLIRAGESTGTLPQALKTAGDHLALSSQFESSIFGWIFYLSSVLLIQLFIGLYLFRFIIPEFVAILGEFDQQPPALMRHVLNALDGIQTIRLRYVTLALLILVTFAFVRAMLGQQGRFGANLLKAITLPVPVLGRTAAKADLSRVCGVMERLFEARIPMNDVLADCAQLDIRAPFRRALQRCRARVESGSSLADALKEETVFPPSFVTLLTLGEASGKLPDAAARLYDIYSQQVIGAVRATVDILGPVGVLGLGAVTLVIYGSIFVTLVSLVDALVYSL